MAIATRRQSKYVSAVRLALEQLGHATNADLASAVRARFPDVSDTTVHRITSRMLADGECSAAPVSAAGAMRFDQNLLQHDHFECSHCGNLRDIVVPRSVRAELQRELGGCELSGSLMVVGNCHQCLHKS